MSRDVLLYIFYSLPGALPGRVCVDEWLSSWNSDLAQKNETLFETSKISSRDQLSYLSTVSAKTFEKSFKFPVYCNGNSFFEFQTQF